MSLLRLLAAGKSLVGLKQSNSQYRVTSERLLPQFDSKKNPFRSSADKAPQPIMTVAGEAVPPQPESKCPELPAVGTDRSKSEMERATEKGTSALKPVSQKLAVWANRCAAKLAGSIHGPQSRPARPAIPNFTKPLVQGELSLERVRVVRNDLTDSDLDIVRCKPEAASAKSVEEQTDSEPTDGAWIRVTGRLFGAGKT
jgi:hypothetical protein